MNRNLFREQKKVFVKTFTSKLKKKSKIKQNTYLKKLKIFFPKSTRIPILYFVFIDLAALNNFLKNILYRFYTE